MTAPTPFDYMAATLGAAAPAPSWPAEDACVPGMSPTERMRARLRQGRCYGRDLAAAAGVRTSLVMPLLKADIERGRVLRYCDATRRRVYEINTDYDEAQEQRLRDAARLLRRHGWHCSPPVRGEPT